MNVSRRGLFGLLFGGVVASFAAKTRPLRSWWLARSPKRTLVINCFADIPKDGGPMPGVFFEVDDATIEGPFESLEETARGGLRPC